MEINNKDKEIIEELQKISRDKEEYNKTRKKVNIAMWAILICNFLAGCFVSSIYFVLGDNIYLILGLIIILLDIPVYIALKKVIVNINKL